MFRRVVVTTVILAWGLVLRADQEGAGVAEQRIQAFVAAFNSGDADTMLGFYAEALSPELKARRSDDQRRAVYGDLVLELGRLEVQRIEADGDRVTVYCAAQRAGTVQLLFELEQVPPHRISGLGIELGGGPGPELELPPVPRRAELGQEAWTAALDRYLQDLAQRELFSGAVLLAKGDEVLFRGAYGLACREHGIRNTMDTRFGLGSITKVMTKTAIGQLARDGKLSLQDTIAHHLPGYPNQEVAAKVTVDNLLRHTSGLGDIFVEEFIRGSKTRFRTPEDFFELFASEPLLFEPGEGRQYSNAGYVVLGAIVAAASGEPYEEYIARHVVEPAGMTSSLFPAKDLPTPDVAIGYTMHDFDGPHQEWRNNVFLTPIQGCPAGGLAATADDLLRFDRALRSGRLLGPGWTAWAFTNQVPDVAATTGEALFEDQGWGIAGGAPGVNAVLESDGDSAAVVLANMDPPIAMVLGKQLREAMVAEQ